jgi:alkanesulfonate monooxygenase SsuD/methylene tetrahydromethanopterin reductase-like flavin-dependent oxidoreductase (luciferase family)
VPEVGINIPASTLIDPVRVARHAEALGFDFVSTADHPSGTTPTNETWTMLCFIAAATSKIRIATRVLGVPYRAPAMVAKMAETLDRLSGGRLILGLGGGSADDEHLAFGLGVRTPREKTVGLEEAVRVIRGLWLEPSFTYEGTLYRTESAELEPKPARPIPIWLGTFAPRALAVTGRLADGWIPSLGYASEEELIAMRDRVLAAAVDAGRAPSAITYAVNMPIDPLNHAAVDQVARLADNGFTAFNFMLDATSLERQAELLATEVVPRIR